MDELAELAAQVERTVDWLNGLPLERFSRPGYLALPELVASVCQAMVERQLELEPEAYAGATPVVPVLEANALGAQLAVIWSELRAVADSMADQRLQTIDLAALIDRCRSLRVDVVAGVNP